MVIKENFRVDEKRDLSHDIEEYVKTVVITTFEGFNIALLQIFNILLPPHLIVKAVTLFCDSK